MKSAPIVSTDIQISVDVSLVLVLKLTNVSPVPVSYVPINRLFVTANLVRINQIPNKLSMKVFLIE